MRIFGWRCPPKSGHRKVSTSVMPTCITLEYLMNITSDLFKYEIQEDGGEKSLVIDSVGFHG